MERPTKTFCPDRVLSYFRVEWLPLTLVTVSGLVYNIGLLATPWFEGRLAQCLADILGGSETAARMALLVLAYILTRLPLLLYVGVVLLGFCYYRMFSRNISKRTEENYKYYAVKDRIRNKFSGLKDQWDNRRLYHYYRCPQCRQKLRVPRGRGRIQISCPRCGTQFIKKS